MSMLISGSFIFLWGAKWFSLSCLVDGSEVRRTNPVRVRGDPVVQQTLSMSEGIRGPAEDRKFRKQPHAKA